MPERRRKIQRRPKQPEAQRQRAQARELIALEVPVPEGGGTTTTPDAGPGDAAAAPKNARQSGRRAPAGRKTAPAAARSEASVGRGRESATPDMSPENETVLEILGLSGHFQSLINEFKDIKARQAQAQRDTMENLHRVAVEQRDAPAWQKLAACIRPPRAAVRDRAPAGEKTVGLPVSPEMVRRLQNYQQQWGFASMDEALEDALNCALYARTKN